MHNRSFFSTALILSLLVCWTNAIKSQCITTFPYHETFESGQGMWFTGGTNSDWEWGTPAKPVINGAAEGNKCWVTGGLTGSVYNSAERSWVQSPCFDFSGLAHPYIHFNIFWESERKFDGGNFQYSTDNGNNWYNVGAVNDPSDCFNANWYNYTPANFLSTLATVRDAWSGNVQPTMGSCQGGSGSGGWVEAKHCMPYLAGLPDVIFRFTFGAGTTCNDFDGLAFDDLYIEEAPDIVADYTALCSGTAYTFTDQSSNCPETWNWNFGDPASGVSNTSNQMNPAHTFSGPGTYTVIMTASSICSGPSTVTHTVEVFGVNVITTNAICLGDHNGMASVSTTGGNPPFTYQWQPSGGTGITATGLAAGQYSVLVTDANACTITSILELKDGSEPSLQLAPEVQINSGDSVELKPAVLLLANELQVQWIPSSGVSCDTCLTTWVKPLATTTYQVIITDKNGCTAAASEKVKVTGAKANIYVPNVFQPESDGLNHHFGVYAGANVLEIERMQIYDRWGDLVFDGKNFPPNDPNIGWDGRERGEAVPSAVYIYLIRARLVDDSEVVLSGDVTVLR